jgi:CelD/BcsL family acetyltransferase involved in cellulose biosynthesis
MSVLTVRVLERPEELVPLRQDWARLLQASNADNIFLTWEWLVTWWKHLGRPGRLAIVTVREAGEIVAIAPLMVARPSWRRLVPFHRIQFLGAGSAGADYLDIIVRRGQEREAAEAVSRTLAERGIMLELNRVHADSPATRTLAKALAERGWRVVESSAESCPFIDLSDRDWEDYLASRGREHRYAFRRKLRALGRQFRVRFELVDREADRSGALAAFLRLHDARFSTRGGSDGLHTPALRAFHDEFSRIALERGWLRLGLLTLDEAAAAAVYGFHYAGRFYFYQSGFDPAFDRWGVGVVALGLSIRAAIDEGAREYDFLHGDEPYKFHWAPQARPLLKVEVFPPRSRGRLTRGFLEVRRAAHARRDGGPRFADGAASR